MVIFPKMGIYCNFDIRGSFAATRHGKGGGRSRLRKSGRASKSNTASADLDGWAMDTTLAASFPDHAGTSETDSISAITAA